MLRICLILAFLLINVTVGSSILPYTKPVIIKPLRITIEEKIIGVLQDSGYTPRMQEIILVQAIHESGNFTNNLTKKWNNPFAIWRNPYDTLSIGNHGYAEGRGGWEVYRNIEEATRAYIDFTRALKYPQDTTLEAYVAFLKRKRYFEADQKVYLNSMKRILNKRKQYESNSTSKR